jgi:hypothetical protein
MDLQVFKIKSLGDVFVVEADVFQETVDHELTLIRDEHVVAVFRVWDYIVRVDDYGDETELSPSRTEISDYEMGPDESTAL